MVKTKETDYDFTLAELDIGYCIADEAVCKNQVLSQK